MSKLSKIEQEIAQMEQVLQNTDTPAAVKESLTAALKEAKRQRDELAEKGGNDPGPGKKKPAKSANAAKPAKVAASVSLDDCHDIIAKYNKEKRTEKKRVEKRKKAGKSKELSVVETVQKTAKTVQHKTAEKKVTATQQESAGNKVVDLVKSILEGIESQDAKRAFVRDLVQDLNRMLQLKKLEDGGYIASGETGMVVAYDDIDHVDPGVNLKVYYYQTSHFNHEPKAVEAIKAIMNLPGASQFDYLIVGIVQDLDRIFEIEHESFEENNGVVTLAHYKEAVSMVMRSMYFFGQLVLKMKAIGDDLGNLYPKFLPVHLMMLAKHLDAPGSEKEVAAMGARIKSAIARDRAYRSNQEHELRYKRKGIKNPRYRRRMMFGGQISVNAPDNFSLAHDQIAFEQGGTVPFTPSGGRTYSVDSYMDRGSWVINVIDRLRDDDVWFYEFSKDDKASGRMDLIDDGYLKDPQDMEGLHQYLVKRNIINENDRLINQSGFYKYEKGGMIGLIQQANSVEPVYGKIMKELLTQKMVEPSADVMAFGSGGGFNHLIVPLANGTWLLFSNNETGISVFKKSYANSEEAYQDFWDDPEAMSGFVPVDNEDYSGERPVKKIVSDLKNQKYEQFFAAGGKTKSKWTKEQKYTITLAITYLYMYTQHVPETKSGHHQAMKLITDLRTKKDPSDFPLAQLMLKNFRDNYASESDKKSVDKVISDLGAMMPAKDFIKKNEDDSVKFSKKSTAKKGIKLPAKQLLRSQAKTLTDALKQVGMRTKVSKKMFGGLINVDATDNFSIAHDQVGFAKGGKTKGKKAMTADEELEAFDLDNLDLYERSVYDDFEKNGKVSALKIVIGNVEGSYSELSPKLADIAERYEL